MIASKRSPTADYLNARSQRRPEKPRVASVHLRPRPMALPHLRRPLPVLGDGTQTHRACARRKHAAEHVRILPRRSLAAKEVVRIGLALTGTLQMRVSHSPKLVSSHIDRP